MREIMFRGWSVTCNNWIYGLPSYDGAAEITEIQNIDDGDFEAVITESIGEYTDIKDKQDNPVFEGDIVKVELLHYLSHLEKYNGRSGKVKILEGHWVIDFGDTAIPVWSEVYTIIIEGNIMDKH